MELVLNSRNGEKGIVNVREGFIKSVLRNMGFWPSARRMQYADRYMQDFFDVAMQDYELGTVNDYRSLNPDDIFIGVVKQNDADFGSKEFGILKREYETEKGACYSSVGLKNVFSKREFFRGKKFFVGKDGRTFDIYTGDAVEMNNLTNIRDLGAKNWGPTNATELNKYANDFFKIHTDTFGKPWYNYHGESANLDIRANSVYEFERAYRRVSSPKTYSDSFSYFPYGSTYNYGRGWSYSYRDPIVEYDKVLSYRPYSSYTGLRGGYNKTAA